MSRIADIRKEAGKEGFQRGKERSGLTNSLNLLTVEFKTEPNTIITAKAAVTVLVHSDTEGEMERSPYNGNKADTNKSLPEEIVGYHTIGNNRGGFDTGRAAETERIISPIAIHNSDTYL